MENQPTRPAWLDDPPVPPPPEEPSRPFWLGDEDGLPPRSFGSAPPPERERQPWLKPALVGALVGAIVAAAMSAGIVAAVDDDRADDPSTASATSARSSSRLAGEQLDVQGVLDEVGEGVVSINVTGTGGPFTGSRRGAGSGMIIDESGLVLTNAHVIDQATEISVSLADGQEVAADLVGSIPSNDVALVQLRETDDLVPVVLGDSSEMQVGDDVVAVGNALGLGSTPTVTTGIVSALNREIKAENGVTLSHLVQTDAAINPGNSGGPLVNAAGEVIGVNTAIAGGAENIGFALAIDSLKPLIEDLRSGGGEVRGGAFLGVSTINVGDVRPSVLERFEVEVSEGAFIAEVVPSSGADEAGLQPGDVIVAVGGRDVSSAADVADTIADREPGTDVEITYLRKGEERTTTATLGSRGVER